MSDKPPSFTPQQAFEFMQKMWNPFGFTFPGMTPAAQGTASAPIPNPLTMLATLDPAEIDKKIAEVRIIENWLAMSLNFMQMTVKTLELQKASLEALRSGAAAATEAQPTSKKHRMKESE